MLGPSELNGLPLHPLIVHVPVVLVPLSLIGVVAALIRPAWKRWLLPLVTGALGASVIAIQLAVGSGRELRGTLGESKLIERHEDLALQARPLVLVFFLLVAAALYLDRRGDRAPDGAENAQASTGATSMQARLATAALPLALVAGVVATAWVVRTGEAGSKATWEGEIGYSQRVAEGADKGSGGKAGDAPSTSSPAKAGASKVQIKGFSFDPKEVTVHVGDAVTWTNADTAKHSAKSRSGEGPKEFSTKPLGKGDSDSVTFDKPGTYMYVCGFHTYMKGEVRVLK